MNDTAENSEHPPMPGFQDLGLEANLIAALHRLNLDEPTEAQRRLIPLVLEGQDCLARASTGAGKTNAYLLPILQTIEPEGGLQAIVLQPTRALALQLQRNVRRFAPEQAVRVAVAARRRRDRAQPEPSAESAELLIGTPRGIGELVRRGRLDWSVLRALVIDEVDAILDERGPDQLLRICASCDRDHQTIIIAGTLSEPVRALAAELLHEPVEIDTPPGPTRSLSAEQTYFEVEEKARFETLLSFCKQETPRLAIVFTNTERQARDLVKRLERAWVSCRWIGARRPPARDGQRPPRPRRQRSEVIIANDPAARRISTVPASHLLHYELPDDVDLYMRRLEQAARLGKHGLVIAFVRPDQQELREEIEQRIGQPLQKREPPPRADRRRREKPPQPDRKRKPPPTKSDDTSENNNADEAQTGRLSEVLFRDRELESRGVQPVKRTLGSRFRSARRGKPLRRPDAPK
jgi:ATP-dependent RNA helicase DeaD